VKGIFKLFIQASSALAISLNYVVVNI